MVSDVAFYIVLALLVVTFALLVLAGIFLKNQLQNTLLGGGHDDSTRGDLWI